MKFISIQEAINKGKGKVSIRGWVYRERGSKEFRFIILRDSTNIIQCIFKKENFSKKWNELNSILIEASMEITGTIKKDKRAPTGYEIQVSDYKLIGPAIDFPIYPGEGFESLLDKRHLWLRSRYMTSILKIRSTVLGSLNETVRKKGFIQADPPMFNTTTSEGGSEVFQVPYFGKKAFLNQSWQFYAENFIHALEKVYTLSPSFRAEKSRTSHHLTEFWHFEVEQAWADVNDLIKLAEECIINAIKAVLKYNKTELEILKAEHLKKIKTPFPKITYKQAVTLLNKKGYKIKYGRDFSSNEEKALTKHYKNFVVVTNYPLETLKFYHGEDPKNPGTGTNFNLLAPEVGELVDGSQREPSLEKIKQRLKKAKVDLGKSDWYLDSRRYGSVPHAGFGLGTERFIQWICNLNTIKDAIPFPRTPTRIRP